MEFSSPWLRLYRRIPEPRLRLVCFPHAGGSASFFRSWPHRLPGDVEVLAVQYPGRQDRLHEPCVDSMEPLADALTDALVPLLDRRVALFGHSMGASVAHEVALRLERLHGHVVDTLFVSGRLPPRHQRPRDVHHDDEGLIADVRKLDRSDSAVLDDPDMRELMLPAIRADYRLTDTYRPSPSPVVGAPVVAYAGEDDPCVRVWDLSAWAEVTRAGFDVVVFPGDHFYLRAYEPEVTRDVVRRLEARSVRP